MNITLFHDYDPDGSIRPVWLSIEFEESPRDESAKYIDVSHYETCDVMNFEDDVSGCSVHMGELLAGDSNHIGINIEKIKQRVGDDYSMIKRFILLVSDVVEVMAISKNLYGV